jgi:hypothetical protein
MLAEGLIAHLVGDYVLQPHWMATEKVKVVAGDRARCGVLACVNLTCCRPNVYLCGIEAQDYGVVGDVPLSEVCPACRVVDERNLPCPVPGCSP